MRFARSLRVKLSILYLLTIVVPVVIIVLIMPKYYENLMAQDSQTLTSATLSALSRNIDTYLDDLNRLTLIPYLDNDVMKALKLKASREYSRASDYEKLNTNQALYSTLPSFLRNTRKDILNTIILPFDGSVFVATKYGLSSTIPDYPFTRQAWYNEAKAADGDVVFINPHPQDYLLTPIATQVFSVARLIKDPDSSLPLAVIMADADNIILRDIVHEIKLNVRSVIAIFGTNKQLLYSSQPLSSLIVEGIVQKKPVIEDTEDSYLPVMQSTASAQWTVVILLSQSEINERLRWLSIAGWAFAIGGLCVTLLIFFVLSRWIITPFRKMMDVMQQVQEGDLQTRFLVEGNDEIAVLGNAFNAMVMRLNEMIEREYVATLNQRNAEYRALQSQIQPHFLYNTLNGFIGLNRLGERKVLEKAILSLSGMLHHMLIKSDQVTVKEEFLFLQRYCDLQALRFSDRMSFVLHYDEAVADFKIPKVLLQPLVENAIIHGMELADHPCHLQVRAMLIDLGRKEGNEGEREEKLRILVEDDGIGFVVSTQEEGRCLGLENVRERLKIAYHATSFSIESEPGCGTCVIIEIPIQEAES